MTKPIVVRALLRAWLLTALIDAIFASSLNIAYGSTAWRVWQGVASTLLGPSALQGGARTVIIGLLMHLGVALGWTCVFLALALSSERIRRAMAGRGWIGVAAAYGPIIWLIMSFVVVPTLVGRAPTINLRWWINLVAHVPFITIPMLWSLRPALDVRTGGALSPA